MGKKFSHGDIANVQLTHDGVTRTLRAWATVLGIPYEVVRMRFKRGKRTFDELLSAKGARGVKIKIDRGTDGETRIVQMEHTLLDDLFSPDTAAKVREIARQAGMAPLQVVQKIVEKKAAELLAPEQTS